MVEEAVDVGFARIAVLGAVGSVEVAYPSFLHALLDGEVEHGLLFAVVDAGDAGVVALLVVGLELLDELGGQVLQRHLRVVLEVFLAIDHDFGDALAVYLDGAVVVYFCSGKLLDEFLEHGALGQAVGIGIEDEGVGLHLHLSQLGRHLSFLQHLAVLLEGDGAQVDALVVLWQSDIAVVRLEANVADAQDVVACLDGWKLELSLEVRRDAGSLCAVLGLQQHHRGTRQRLVQRAVLNGTTQGNLLCYCC